MSSRDVEPLIQCRVLRRTSDNHPSFWESGAGSQLRDGGNKKGGP